MVDAGEEMPHVAFQHPAVRAVALTAVIVHHVGFQAHQAVVCAFAGLAGVAVPDKALCQGTIQDVIDQSVQHHLVHKCGGVYHAALRLVDGKDLKLTWHIAYLLPDAPVWLPHIADSQLTGELFRASQCMGFILDCFALAAFSLPGFEVGFVKHLKAAQFFVCQNDPPLVRVTVVGCIRQGWPTSAGCIYHLPASASDRMRFPLMGALLSAYAYSSHGSIRAGRTP